MIISASAKTVAHLGLPSEVTPINQSTQEFYYRQKRLSYVKIFLCWTEAMKDQRKEQTYPLPSLMALRMYLKR